MSRCLSLIVRRRFGSASAAQRVLYSGMQPSGSVHLGNYLGAIRPWSRVDAAQYDQVLFCAVDLHAMSLLSTASAQQRKQLAASGQASVRSAPVLLPYLLPNVRRFVATLLACGIDGGRVSIYRQSAVPAHCELLWLLSCVAPLGRLQRQTQFKDKQGTDPTLALLSYPVLMAADVLLFNATHVPVGEDQRQHLELAVALARIFNHLAGQSVFVEPQPLGLDARARRIQSLADPSVKMSKSDPLDRARINLTDSADEIASKIRRAVTDTDARIVYDAAARPGVANLLDICAELRDTTPEALLAQRAFGSAADLKQYTIDTLVEHIVPIGQRIAQLESDQSSTIDTVLFLGAQRAQSLAQRQLQHIKTIVGLL
jgi:tryptophanyl-tRNA synthetase